MTDINPLVPLLGMAITGILLIGVRYCADYLFKKFDKKKKENNKKPNKNDVWEKVPGGLYRTEVPGGWLYLDCIRGHSVALAFVPFPKEEK